MASTSTDASSVDDRGRLISPIMRRTLSTGATAGSSRASSLYGLDAPTDASPSGSKTPGGSSASSRKGKERVLEDTGVDEVDVTGEMVTSSGNAAKGLRELVKRSTVGEEVRWTGRSGVEPVKEEVQLDPPPGMQKPKV